MTTVTTIWTIGHSNKLFDHLLGLLRQHAVSTLVDVRSHPYSKWAPHFQKNPLSRALQEEHIDYVFLGRELGGRPEGAEFYDVDGHVDYARRTRAPDFQRGIQRLEDLAGCRPTAIMCAEENPARCHRRLLVMPALEQRGIAVVHIRGDGRLQSEEDLRDSSPQLSLFQ